MLNGRRRLLQFSVFVSLALVVLLAALLTTHYFNSQTVVRTPPTDALYLDTTQSIEARVADLLSYMTQEEKIGQMTLVEKGSVERLSDIGTYGLGALLSGSGSKPEENTIEGWKEMIDGYQEEAKKSRLRIPLLYGSDAIHGHAHVLGATVFPHMIGLGATGNAALVKEIAEDTAEELARTGVNWNFAPNLDTPQDIRWGRIYETFSDDPELVAKLGTAYLEGLQAPTGATNEQIHVLGTLKHFVGLGGMGWNTSLNKNFKIDQGVTRADEELLRSVYLLPFIAAIDGGALSIMVGLNTWGEERTVRQKQLITDLLKKELGFKGFVVSDWYGVHEGTYNTFLATVKAINAGVDLVMLPFDYETFVRHVRWANRFGLISDERIDDAVSRILHAKFALGLFDDKDASQISLSLSDTTHRALAREAVAQSLVLLKNEDQTLPIKKGTQRIHVAGSAADNVGRQMGAWSIEWQGVDGNWPEGATSILEGIQQRAAVQGTSVEYDLSGDFSETENVADIGIAIVGEKPYAEGWGDTEYPILSEEDLTAIENLQVTSKKVVVIIVSGRPMLIENEIGSFDALIAAWLPGSEGAGVADVLFGDKRFTGTLPLPWPKHAEQLPITTDGKTSDDTSVLFLRYFGLKI
jgi:beta-glucosidase